MRRNRASNIFHFRVVSVFIFSILGVFRYIHTAELQEAAYPWCSPRSPLPSELFPCLTSVVRSARCKAMAASFCPGCIQSLRRQNKDTLDFCPMNIRCLLFTSPEASMMDKFDHALSFLCDLKPSFVYLLPNGWDTSVLLACLSLYLVHHHTTWQQTTE